MQALISRLAEVDVTKPTLLACETLGPYMSAVLEEMACVSVLPFLHPSERVTLAHCLRMPASIENTWLGHAQDTKTPQKNMQTPLLNERCTDIQTRASLSLATGMLFRTRACSCVWQKRPGLPEVAGPGVLEQWFQTSMQLAAAAPRTLHPHHGALPAGKPAWHGTATGLALQDTPGRQYSRIRSLT